ncbi:ABC transporter permease [Metabacillus fastidiosus]|uniref:Proline/glycine betaine ABC transporter permease n=1 Tax=Metabacillus fastidiosus TaxID=1458 RepID=A0ABU6P2F4_9BACI|nr:proline/glycine betaine ABC transporter permease [Metabacillus fastidiosus]MED4402684.1 proline/glycine betaine ABC transporter permease [Metabacillus fastidiosus]MED4462043.1 proline/glycine betaine ABC transporter permease [Metabacillus fastidiosus]
MENLFPKLPIANWIDSIIEWLVNHFEPVFEGASTVVESFVDGIVSGLGIIPSFLLMIIVGLIAWKVCNWKIALFTIIGLFLIDNLGYWSNMLDTIALVIISVGISIILGIPIGIWASQSETVSKVVTPLLDFMQTMPAFVYLLPAIFFFNIGVVPGVVASVIFAMPPTIRLTILGIKQVPKELIEATEAFGSTTAQKLIKVQFPIALPTIMAGINQSIMLALSMVVIASMVGAPGLGADVYRAVTQLQTGTGFEAGLAIVIIAIILDRITQNIGKKKTGGEM